MKWFATFSLLLLLANATLVDAQIIGRHYLANSQTDINVGVFTSLNQSCKAAPLPVVVLVAGPAHGKVTFKKARLRVNNLKRCPPADLPAYVAIYRSSAGYIGQDAFTLEIIAPDGNSQFQRITLTITSNDSTKRMRA